MSFISSFEIIKVVVTDPCILFSVSASIVQVVAVIPNWAKIFLQKEQLLLLRNLLFCLIMSLKILLTESF